jgi:hypothetical protein
MFFGERDRYSLPVSTPTFLLNWFYFAAISLCSTKQECHAMQRGKRALTCNATAEKALAVFDELNHQHLKI